jgi:hypothetical protein
VGLVFQAVGIGSGGRLGSRPVGGVEAAREPRTRWLRAPVTARGSVIFCFDNGVLAVEAVGSGAGERRGTAGDLVDPARLRQAWSADPPDFRSAAFLQAFWLADLVSGDTLSGAGERLDVTPAWINGRTDG